MATGDVPSPYVNYNFLVEIGGITRAAFHDASGFDSTIDIIEYAEGGHITPTKFAGMVKYANITLKRGITDDVELFTWHQQWAKCDPAATRRDGSIVLLDRSGQEKVRWNFTRAWPCKWVGPDLTAEGNDVAIETLELAHEGLERV